MEDEIANKKTTENVMTIINPGVMGRIFVRRKLHDLCEKPAARGTG